MSVNAIVRIRGGTHVDSDQSTDTLGVTIEIQEPLDKGGVSIYATSAEGFDRLAAAATECANRMRARGQPQPVVRAV